MRRGQRRHLPPPPHAPRRRLAPAGRPAGRPRPVPRVERAGPARGRLGGGTASAGAALPGIKAAPSVRVSGLTQLLTIGTGGFPAGFRRISGGFPADFLRISGGGFPPPPPGTRRRRRCPLRLTPRVNTGPPQSAPRPCAERDLLRPPRGPAGGPGPAGVPSAAGGGGGGERPKRLFGQRAGAPAGSQPAGRRRTGRAGPGPSRAWYGRLAAGPAQDPRPGPDSDVAGESRRRTSAPASPPARWRQRPGGNACRARAGGGGPLCSGVRGGLRGGGGPGGA